MTKQAVTFMPRIKLPYESLDSYQVLTHSHVVKIFMLSLAVQKAVDLRN